MKITPAEQALLEFTKREKVILAALERLGDASMQELADYIRLPRTSIYWPLTQLCKRNIVAYNIAGKRKRWYSRMGELPLRKTLGSLESVAGDVRVVEGTAQIREMYNTALELHKTERVLILEGNAAVSSIAKQGGIDFMLAWHRRAHKNGIIIESVIGQKVYDKLLRLTIDPKVVKSLAQWETWIGHVVPDEWIEADAAAVIFRDVAILADWSKARAVLINTPDIVRLLRNFCAVYQSLGHKVDIVSDVRGAASRLY